MTIVSMIFGSHLYGTDTPSSDKDFKAIYVPNGRDIALQRVRDVIVTQTREDRSTGAKNTAEDTDTETFALHKYLALLAQGQTVALDMLFAPADKMLHIPDDVWKCIFDNRTKLISRKADSFIGYCRQQANKYGIKGSRMHETRLIMEFFAERLDGPMHKVDHYADELSAYIQGFQHTTIDLIANPNGVELAHLNCCNRKAPFTITIKEAWKIYANLFEKYGERTRKAEQSDGVDWKAISHAVRVGEQGVELLKTGMVQFPRPNAEYLKQIKTGQLSYPPLAEYIEHLFEEVEKASAESTLPAEADQKWIDTLVHEVYGYEVGESLH